MWPSSKVAEVVGRLAATGVHRLFICRANNDYRPIGVISLTDVLRLLVPPEE